ncbi:unnamed protein product [Rotaria socialis]|uniref:Uncharacterized protein n=1 Tax=Rotaria socialis TaxID=392032 RepID=A0A818E147_9BILA|nr:unnamed protein product [Rotaria socialis]CAF3670097.1 unnamed protein product [Rotaria socialis]
MLERKLTIIFAIAGIASALGFICGVAPGFYTSSYGLFGIGLGLLLFLSVLLTVATVIFQYQNKDQVLPIFSTCFNIFDKRLSRDEIISINLTNVLLFIAGIFLGVLCELLLKALSTPVAIHIVIVAILIFALLILFIIIVIVAYKDLNKLTPQNIERKSTLVEPNRIAGEPTPESKLLTKPQDGPKNTAARVNRYHPRLVEDDLKSTWFAPSRNEPMMHSNNNYFNRQKPPSTVQLEYQKLLHPSPHYFVNDKVFVNDQQLAQIIGVEDMNIYRLQYLDTGLIDLRNGSELRKALPLVF